MKFAAIIHEKFNASPPGLSNNINTQSVSPHLLGHAFTFEGSVIPDILTPLHMDHEFGSHIPFLLQ